MSTETETYRPEEVAAYFDAYGEREWARFEATLNGRIKYAIHRRYLDAYVSEGMRVADVGSGPGRFAIDAMRAGARLTLVDLSPEQLRLARLRIEESGLLDCVEAFERLDVCDLSPLADESFDLVLCYGGALSYVVERHVDGLRELVRIAKPGAPVLLSVMSLYGTMKLVGPLDAREFMEQADEHLPWDELLSAPEVLYTRPGSHEFHQRMALFTSAYIADLLDRLGCDLQAMAAANPLSTGWPLTRVAESAEASARLEALELAICEQPRLLDSGEHLVVVARKRARAGGRR